MATREIVKGLQCLTLVLASVISVQASAATVAYYLDQSNVSVLPDGTDYLKVTISDSTTVSGNIDFKVETLAPLNSIATSGFGIDQFGFNTTQTLTSSNFVLPTNWAYGGYGNMDGFGKFQVTDTNGAANRLTTLNFSITGITGDSIWDYVMMSSGNAGQGNTFFAAHVAGFLASDNVTTGAYFGGSTPVPLPAAAWLFGSGLLGLAGIARRKKYKSS